MSCCGAPETSVSASSPPGRKASRSISRAECRRSASWQGVELLDKPGAPLLAGAGWLRGHVLAEHSGGDAHVLRRRDRLRRPRPSDRPLAYFGHAYHDL